MLQFNYRYNLNEAMLLKKYFIFILSFLVLYVAFQLLSGAILTALYIPDFIYDRRKS